MISTVYPREWQEEDNERVFQIMRARTVQEALDKCGITDPPRNEEEYRGALDVFRRHIILNQPRALTQGISFEEACKVPFSTSGNARGVIYQWLYVSLCAAALGENYNEAVACMMGVWETSCQFTDEIFAAGIRLAFSLGAVMLQIPAARPFLWNATWEVLGAYYGETVSPRVARHDHMTHELSVDLFLLLQVLARGKDDWEKMGISPRGAAAAFDQKTDSRFKVEEWEEDLEKRL